MSDEVQINPLDFNPNIAIGIQLPLTNDKSNVFNQTFTTTDQIKYNLKNLLLTEPGERIMLTDYGCGLRKKLFEQQNPNLQNEIDNLIRTAIQTWMPYINVRTIQFNLTEDHFVQIKIAYSTAMDPKNLQILLLEPNVKMIL